MKKDSYFNTCNRCKEDKNIWRWKLEGGDGAAKAVPYCSEVCMRSGLNE